MKIPSAISAMIAGILLTLVSVWYGQNHDLLPIAASEEAPLVDGLFNVMMTIGTGIFLLVQGIIIISIIRFRRREGDDTDGPPIHGNIPLEILWTAIPAIIVLGISVYSFEVYLREGGVDPMNHAAAHAPKAERMAQMPGAAIAATLTETPATKNRNQLEQEQALQDPATAAVRNETIPQRKDAPGEGVTAGRLGPTPDKQGKAPEIVVNVTGLQFAWIFTYPDSGVVAAELHVPNGREVKLNISANDVIHAFWVPEFRLKQDAVPGLQSELRFTPNRIGEYPLICAELCGAYHGAMKTKVLVQAPQDFDNWIQSQKVATAEDLTQAIAANPANLSTDEFLAPYTQDLGISAAALQELPHSMHQMHHADPVSSTAS
ncbi:MAG: cytochrome c oxidase subunit II [Trichocoleus desertorum ATA4-8-CV12]|nr:cytochrome c oxidase subunit II [Trichocoleus desertorum ATA4-8-CV12]